MGQLGPTKKGGSPLNKNSTILQVRQKICKEFLDLFKPEVGCLKDFEFEVMFMKPVYSKPQIVLLAPLDDSNKAYDSVNKKGIRKPTQFNKYGIPVVSIQKVPAPGQKRLIFISVGITRSL